jgi:transposase InsO family protein
LDSEVAKPRYGSASELLAQGTTSGYRRVARIENNLAVPKLLAAKTIRIVIKMYVPHSVFRFDLNGYLT